MNSRHQEAFAEYADLALSFSPLCLHVLLHTPKYNLGMALATSILYGPCMNCGTATKVEGKRGAQGLRFSRHRVAGLSVFKAYTSLGLQVCKQYLLWYLKYINMTYFGLFGAPGNSGVQMKTALSQAEGLFKFNPG